MAVKALESRFHGFVGRPLLWDRHDFRFFAFITAIVIYALFGEPTPDVTGWDEMAVGVLLVIAVGAPGLSRFYQDDGSVFDKTGRILLLYGLSVPVVLALVNGHSLSQMLRDVIPFLFLLLPFFLLPLLRRRDLYAVIFRMVIVFLGLVFSLRLLVPAYTAQGSVVSNWLGLTLLDTAYLANAPTVLFTAIFMMGIAGRALYRSASLQGVLKSFVLMALSFIPFAAMFLILQRASFILAAAGLAFLLIIALCKAPVRAVLPLAFALCVLFVLGPDLQAMTGLVAEKTSNVGLNKRELEAAVVLNSVGENWGSILAGKGWGATIESPAVADMTVGYTHSLLTTYWLKTGLIGCFIMIPYLFVFANMLFGLLFRNPVMAVALASPFFIDCFFYASFKSLDFGLLLLLIALWAERSQILHYQAGWCIQKSNSEQ